MTQGENLMSQTRQVCEFTAAVVRDATRGFQLEQMRLSGLGPHEILVKIAGVGVCHTDLAVAGAAGAYIHPAIFGHEGAGVVEAVGTSVSGLAPGDHVVLSYDSCGHCTRCHAGKPYYCDGWQDLNAGPALGRVHSAVIDSDGAPVYSTWFGQSSFGTYAVARENNAVKVDHDLPLEILGPLGCGFQTGAGAVVNSLGVRPGQSIVIFGSGAVGLAAVMAAKVCNAETIVAVDIVESRRNLAEQLGATHTIDGRAEDLAEQLQDITGGADYSFDTSGAASVISTAVNVLAPGGTCALVAFADELRIDSQAVIFGRTITDALVGNASPHVFLPTMIRWWRQGLFPFDKLIEQFPLSEINAAAEASRSGRSVKPVLIP
ncbi:zinc-binding dehydrogenase [Nocardia sp. R7R-8]|uniref:zinc-binding dehydrogenase n=1 Tax=Nocardia sp. R7R-8 TaxID=3459304 RepID=UPI00403E2D98